jgi:hypothetical protein
MKADQEETKADIKFQIGVLASRMDFNHAKRDSVLSYPGWISSMPRQRSTKAMIRSSEQ